jgi:hypothetical protein
MAQANQLMPGEWEAAGRGTSWGLGDGIFTQEAAKTKEAQYLADAVAMGNMDPRAAEGYYQGKLTRSIGNAANKLFGGKVNDPALQEANDLDAVFRSLTEEDIKDPAVALNKVADHLAALGQTQKSIEYRLKAAQVLETTSAAKYQQEDRENKIRIGKASDLGRAAKGALDGLFKANEAGSEAVATGIKDSFLKVYARINGQEEADKLKSLPNEQFMAMLDQTYESSKTIAQQGTEDLNAAKEKNKLEFQDRANKFKAGENQIKATATLIENNRKYTLNREKFDFRRDTVFATQVNKQIDDSQTQVKNLDSKIKDVENDINELPTKPRYYGDISAEGYAAEKARLTAQRDTLVSQRNDLQATGDTLRGKYATFIEGTRASDTGTPGATPADSKPNAKTQLQLWQEADAYAKERPDLAPKIWSEYKRLYPESKSAVDSNAVGGEPEAIKFINTIQDLNKATKYKLLSPSEIKAATKKLRRIEEEQVNSKKIKLEKERLQKLETLYQNTGPLKVFTKY